MDENKSEEMVDEGSELPIDQNKKVETAPPVPSTTPATPPLPSGMEYGPPSEPVRYQEGVKRRSVWWHIATLAGVGVVVGLLVFQQFNGDTAVDNGTDRVIEAIVADGNVTRKELPDISNDVEEAVAEAVKADGELTRAALGPDGQLWKLLKRFQELVVVDPSSDRVISGREEPLSGLLNIVAGLQIETRDGVTGLRRSLKSHDERLANHELASQSRASALEAYLESLSAQYGTTALGIKELRDRAERPLKVRVIIPRTKVVVGK